MIDPNLQKVGINDLLELALTTPVKYYDYRLHNKILSPNPLLEIEITGEFRPGDKVWRVGAFAKNLSLPVELLFFNVTPYHFYTFKKGRTLFAVGKIQHRAEKILFLQPKTLPPNRVGKIYTKYKIDLDEELFESLKRKYLTYENLLAQGLPKEIAKSLLPIHYPDEQFLKGYFYYGDFFGKHLEALKFIEAYRYLKLLKAKKKEFKARCQIFNANPLPFYQALPFKPTPDQQAVINEIIEDLSSSIATRRVIVGDVGSGKSLIMFAIAFLTYPKRSILMAPTTILADQLFSEAKKLLPSFIKIALITSDAKEENLEKFHFLIGTHALLYRELPETCVIMVDEQHRFGTEQRDRLKKIVEDSKGAPHFFQFSATPIPRTQAMIQSALVDFSFIRNAPFKKEVETKIISKDDIKSLLEHISTQLEKGKQVLIVYPLIGESDRVGYKSLEEAKEFWISRFDKVFVTHGKDPNKEEVLRKFRKEGNILLTTTVIEVGISLPKLSTIVIVGAEYLGLGTLHQLRGRVARSGDKGYCFLYTHDPNNPRLRAFCRLKSGFEVAKLDLEFRRAGDILNGKDQSGRLFKWLNIANDAKIVERAKALLFLP